MRSILSGLALVLAVGAHASVVCQSPNGLLRLRDVSRPRETVVDLSALVNTSGTIAQLQDQLAAVQAENARLAGLLAGVSVEDSGATLRLTGMNLQIVSGSGATDGAPNGRGNLIVGYNAPSGAPLNPRGGSHNVVVGDADSHPSYGGLVAGFENDIMGPSSSVTACSTEPDGPRRDTFAPPCHPAVRARSSWHSV